MTTLLIADHDNQSIHAATLHAATAALACGQDLHVLVAGHASAPAAAAAAKIAGVARVLHADGIGHAHGLAETLAAQVVAVAQGGTYSHIVFAATAAGKNAAPRVAALLDVDQFTDVIEVLSTDTFRRPLYAGSVVATVLSEDDVKVFTARTTAFAAAASQAAEAPVVAIEAVADSGLSRFVNRELRRSERPELACAKVVVAGGRALGSGEQFTAVLGPLADKLDAALGASRAAVDAGYAPNDWQVGQTGKIVAPSLYVACGISGAIQHLAGMKDSKVIVAINKDPEAPIFGIADFALEADLFAAVPELTAAI
jgi:electron transfer flavoprotein alpha subunit